MKYFKVSLTMGLIALVCFSCKKEPALQEKSLAGEAGIQASSSDIASGSSHESFDKLPLDLNWTNEYKPNANAFKIVQDNPKIGPGTGKFILYPDAIIGGKNRSQMDYYPNHPLGTEATYVFLCAHPSLLGRSHRKQ